MVVAKIRRDVDRISNASERERCFDAEPVSDTPTTEANDCEGRIESAVGVVGDCCRELTATTQAVDGVEHSLETLAGAKHCLNAQSRHAWAQKAYERDQYELDLRRSVVRQTKEMSVLPARRNVKINVRMI